MELLLNDLSIHKQFSSIYEFRESILRILDMRKLAEKYDHKIYCHRYATYRYINQSTSVYDALQNRRNFTIDEKRSLLSWFTKHGPYWEDIAEHGPDDYVEAHGDLVTCTALGEASYCVKFGIDKLLVSLTPSKWSYSPISATISPRDSSVEHPVKVQNYWEPATLETALRDAEHPIESWQQLEKVCQSKFPLLRFTSRCFDPLKGKPFASSAVNQILSRMKVLNELMEEIDSTGRRTAEGHSLYQKHFTGDEGWFSDSSDTEKREFKNKLTFPHPDKPNSTLSCTWHGKVSTQLLRIHFNWPVSHGESLYIVYIGEKITKR